MTQLAFINAGTASIQMELPSENSEVLPGIPWGDVVGFPTLAYWAYRILERRIAQKTIQYKLGKTLVEEVAACLLGGHGIPASMGLAAFEHLKEKGAYNGEVHSEATLLEWLSEPIQHNGKLSKYRFAKQKAKYLHNALCHLSSEEAPLESGKSLRNWLLHIKGVGPKTASWVARNWLDADDVAILDIHIYRAGLLAKFFESSMTVEKHYFELEEKFLDVAKAMKVSAAELDAVMWYEMQASNSIQRLLEQLDNKVEKKRSIVKTQISNQRQTEPHQFALI